MMFKIGEISQKSVKTTEMNEIGRLYTFLLLYKTMIYTGRAKSSGAMDLAVCFSVSNWNASSFGNCNTDMFVASPIKYKSSTVTM